MEAVSGAEVSKLLVYLELLPERLEVTRHEDDATMTFFQPWMARLGFGSESKYRRSGRRPPGPSHGYSWVPKFCSPE